MSGLTGPAECQLSAKIQCLYGSFFFSPVGTLQVPSYLLFTKIPVFFFPLREKKKLSLLVLLFKVQFFTPFTFFSNLLVFLQDQNSQVFALFIYALTSNLCFQPRFKLKILLPTTRFQDVFKLFVPLHAIACVQYVVALFWER